MAIAGVPQNFYVQQGNGQVYTSWSIVTGASSYVVQRSTDGVSFSIVGSPSVNYFLDTTVAINTLYYYQVASFNSDGTSSYTNNQSVVPTQSGQLSLGQIRLMSQQRADRENSNFVTMPEWNTYINQSYFELYDLLTTTYEDYYFATPITITTDGSSYLYALPNGSNYSSAPPFYKMLGLDMGLSTSNNAYISLNRFNFIDRNRYVFPNLGSTYLGVFNLQYKIVGNNVMFIPTPSANQFLRLWYIPRLTQLLSDSDVMDGVSGWTEYVIVDSAIKALQKEESDTQVLMVQKTALIKRIEESAVNRDAGQAPTISNVRANRGWGNGNMLGMDGANGGW